MKHKKRATVSIELGNNSIKICEAGFIKNERRIRLLKSDIAPGDDKTISREIDSLFKKHNIPRNDIRLNIPRYLVMTNFLKLPSTKDAEIRGMVRIEAIKEAPYLNENVETGFRVAGVSESGYSDVLIAIAQRDVVNRYVNILKDAGLNIKKAALGSESLFLWYLFINKAAPLDADGVTALINIGSEYVDVDIAEKGNLVFTRAFAHSNGYSGHAGEKFIEEASASLLLDKYERGKKFDRIVITGPAGESGKVRDLLKSALGLESEVAEQAGDLKYNSDADLSGDSYAELIGLSMSDKSSIDLRPAHIVAENNALAFKKSILHSGILAALTLAAFLAIAAKDINNKEQQVKLLDSRIAVMEPRVKEARKRLDNIRIAKELSAEMPSAIKIIAEVHKITPPDIKLNVFDYESNKSITLKGSSASLEGAVSYVKLLERSDYFNNASLKYAAKRRDTAGLATDFEISCALSRVK